MEVKITKVEHHCQNHELHNGYWVQGFLIGEIEVGKQILLDRRIRNGIEVLGRFNTSPVKTIDKNIENVLVITTENSVYRVEFL